MPGFGSFGLPFLSRFRTAPVVAVRRPGFFVRSRHQVAASHFEMGRKRDDRDWHNAAFAVPHHLGRDWIRADEGRFSAAMARR